MRIRRKKFARNVLRRFCYERRMPNLGGYGDRPFARQSSSVRHTPLPGQLRQLWNNATTTACALAQAAKPYRRQSSIRGRPCRARIDKHASRMQRALSRRKQGFEYPGERQLDQVNELAHLRWRHSNLSRFQSQWLDTEHQTTNLGVWSSNLSGRARWINDLRPF
jgi:hypothetical protein